MFFAPPPPAWIIENQFQQIHLHNKLVQLENCLTKCYHIDPRSAKLIESKLKPLFENSDDHTLLDDFIHQSKQTHLHFSGKKQGELPSDDATVTGPKWNQILYESPDLRVLWTVTKPGETEPSHRHHWKSLYIILQESLFEIAYEDGTKKTAHWPEGVYPLEADQQAAAYTNIGKKEFKSLRFEFKS